MGREPPLNQVGSIPYKGGLIDGEGGLVDGRGLVDAEPEYKPTPYEKGLTHPDYSSIPELRQAIKDLDDNYGIEGRFCSGKDPKGQPLESYCEGNITSIFTAGSCNTEERTKDSDIDVMVVFKNKKYLEDNLDNIRSTLGPCTSDKLKFWLYYEKQYTDPENHFKPGEPIIESHEDWGGLANLVQLHWQADTGLTLKVDKDGNLTSDGKYYLGDDTIEKLRRRLYHDDNFAISLSVPREEGYELLLPSSRDLLKGVIWKDGNKIAKAILRTAYALNILAYGDALKRYKDIYTQFDRRAGIKQLRRFLSSKDKKESIIKLAFNTKLRPEDYEFEHFKKRLPEICDFFKAARNICRKEISRHYYKFEKSRQEEIKKYFDRTVTELEEELEKKAAEDHALILRKTTNQLTKTERKEALGDLLSGLEPEVLDLFVYDLLAFKELPDQIKQFYKVSYGSGVPPPKLREKEEGWEESVLIKGKILNLVGEYKEAIKSFEEVLHEDEKIPETGYMGLDHRLNRAEILKEKGIALLNLKNSREAEQSFKTSLKFNPRDSDVWSLLSSSLKTHNNKASEEYKLIAETLSEVEEDPRKITSLLSNISSATANEFLNLLQNHTVEVIGSYKEDTNDEKERNRKDIERINKDPALKDDRYKNNLIEILHEKEKNLNALLSLQQNTIHLIETNKKIYHDLLKYYDIQNEQARQKIRRLEREYHRVFNKIIIGGKASESLELETRISKLSKLKISATSNKYPAAAFAGSTATGACVGYFLPALLVPVSMIAAPIAIASGLILLANFLYKRRK